MLWSGSVANGSQLPLSFRCSSWSDRGWAAGNRMERSMTRTLGLIGSGMIGSAIARLAIGAGMDVVLSNSSGPGSLDPLVAELGSRAKASTPSEAAKAGDIVVATIPLSAYKSLPAAAAAGKIVIDTMNYYPQRDGRIAELDSFASTSSELVQRHLDRSRIVKAFNNIDFRRLFTLARLSGSDERSAVPIAGNDEQAKSDVTYVLNLLGYDAVDIGTLSESWRSEPETPVYVKPYFPAHPPEGGTPEEAYRWFTETPGVPVSAATVRGLVDGTVRGTAGGYVPEDVSSFRAGADPNWNE
ncbi:oxidoreductase [Rhodococcus sp. KBW08]|nr:oxidoreductase [Rhodococcus sp. KBW08]